MIVPIPQSTFNELYPHIGTLAVNWAVAEFAIENWTHIIYRGLDGKQNIEKQIPKAFSRKVTFLRLWLPKIGLPPETEKICRDIVDDLDSISETRNAVIHGALMGYDPQTNKVQFFRLEVEVKHNLIRPNPEWLGVSEVLQAAQRSLRLARNAHSLTSEILAAFGA